jgi:predicted nucleic-acid-binding Zn-ribbon protein
MWQCPKCNEKLEESDEVCWSCGTSKEGKEDPSFQREVDPMDPLADPVIEEPEGDGPTPSIEDELAGLFVCSKCGNGGGRTERFSFHASIFRQTLSPIFVAVACTKCGYTEFYNWLILRDLER